MLHLFMQYKVLIIVILSIAVIIFFIVRGKKKRNKARERSEEPADGTESETAYEPFDARVLDNRNRKVYTTELSGDVRKQIMDKYNTLGRHWNRDGKFVYGVIRQLDGKYKPIIIEEESTRSPQKLHNDTQHHYLEHTMPMDKPKSFMEKYNKYLIWGAWMAFIFAILIMNRQGGH